MYYAIEPYPKPRQSRSDKWNVRPCVLRYRTFKDQVRAAGLELPLGGYHVVFLLKMPATWSNKKKQANHGQPHQQRPDKDNLEKALLDAVYGEDCRVWDGRTTKLWSYNPGIVIMSIEEGLKYVQKILKAA